MAMIVLAILLAGFFTLSAGADVEDARTQTLLGRDAEALIGRVLLLAGQDSSRRREAVRGDPLHRHVLLELHEDRPGV